MKSHYRAAAGSVISDFVRSFAPRENFPATRKFFGGAKILEKLDRIVAIDFVKKSSKSELSSRFSSRSKFKNFVCHFLANSADRPRIYANSDYDLMKSWDDRLNSPKSGMWIAGDQTTGNVLLGAQEMCCLEHRRCAAWSTGDVLLGTQ